jgi:hypothetical protein
MVSSESAIAERLEGELKEAEGRWRTSENDLRSFVDTRLGEQRDELEGEHERRTVMLVSRVEALEKGPKGLDEDTAASLQALRERVTSLEERPARGTEMPGLDEAAEGRISRLENGIVTISQNLQEGGGRIGALEDSIGQLGERLQATRQELLSSITAMAERVERLEAGPLHPPGFPPPWQPNLQLPLPPQHTMPPVEVQPVAPVREPPAPSRLQQRLLRRIAKHPKDVVKSAILTLIQKYGRLAGTELREMVVEEQQLCSKSSFYRLLEELEKDRLISIVGDGKEKTLLPTEHKHRRIEER